MVQQKAQTLKTPRVWWIRREGEASSPSLHSISQGQQDLSRKARDTSGLNIRIEASGALVKDPCAQLCTAAEDLSTFKGLPGLDMKHITDMTSMVKLRAYLPKFSRPSPNLVCTCGGGVVCVCVCVGGQYETESIKFRQLRKVPFLTPKVVRYNEYLLQTTIKNTIGYCKNIN